MRSADCLASIDSDGRACKRPSTVCGWICPASAAYTPDASPARRTLAFVGSACSVEVLDPLDTQGTREQWMCGFVYDLDIETEFAPERHPMTFTDVYLGHVATANFRRIPGPLITRISRMFVIRVIRGRRHSRRIPRGR